METKLEMINAIYKKIADKRLDLWCKIERKRYRTVDWIHWKEPREWIIWLSIKSVTPDWSYNWQALWVFWSDSWTYACTEFSIDILNSKFDDGEFIYKIVWRPVMIGDVLDYIRQDAWDTHLQKRYEDIQKLQFKVLQSFSPREPIDNQSDNCIKFIYSLLE